MWARFLAHIIIDIINLSYSKKLGVLTLNLNPGKCLGIKLRIPDILLDLS
jgi:hypothetical protein